MTLHACITFILQALQKGKTGASHFLVNELMKLHIGKIVDFEGSNIEGVARFYKGFGAHHTFYSTVKINRLPFYLRWLKL